MSEGRDFNYVKVLVTTEAGCKIRDGEYSVYIIGVLGALDISSIGGVDDISLIRDCIENSLDELNLPEEGTTEILLRETGEREDVFWNKYYAIEHCERMP